MLPRLGSHYSHLSSKRGPRSSGIYVGDRWGDSELFGAAVQVLQAVERMSPLMVELKAQILYRKEEYSEVGRVPHVCTPIRNI